MANRTTELKRRLTRGNENRTVLIVGDGFVASSLALTLEDVDVTVVTDDRRVAKLAADHDVRFVVGGRPVDSVPDDVPAVRGELVSARTFRRIDAGDASVAVVAVDSDGSTMLATRLLETTFDVPEIVALVSDPRVDEVASDVETVCVSETVASQVESVLDELLVVAS